MSTIAYAAVTGNTIGADSGITVMEHRENNQADVIADTVEELPADGYGQMDQDAADAMLARMGYTRTGQWTASDHQWAAEVETRA